MISAQKAQKLTFKAHMYEFHTLSFNSTIKTIIHDEDHKNIIIYAFSTCIMMKFRNLETKIKRIEIIKKTQ